jgi:ABC-type bacteriocin/lantibiotic exporter with double-glycine peptidase domain
MSVICQAITTFVSSAIFGFVINWKLSLLTIASMPLIVIGSVISINIVSSQLTSDKEATEKSSKIAIEAIGGIRTVTSLHKEEYFLSKYIQILESKLKYCSFRIMKRENNA